MNRPTGQMPHKATAYAGNVKLHNYINAFYQVRDILSYSPKKVLVVGIGTGIEIHVLRQKYGLNVTTLDIDEEFKPDHVGSIEQMTMFETGSFDVVVASHVLEHLPFPALAPAVREVARVGRNAIVYLPLIGRHFRISFLEGLWGKSGTVVARLPSLRWMWRHPPQDRPVLCGHEHFWEVGCSGSRASDLRRVFAESFRGIDSYQNPDWPYSYNVRLTGSRTCS